MSKHPSRSRSALAALIILGSGGIAVANPVFVGDLESGDLNQFQGIDVHPGTSDRLVPVSSPVRQGQYAVKATVQPGDYVKLGSRAELVMTDPMFNEGEERWFHWYTMFPEDFQTSPLWHLFIQWHSGDFGVPLQFSLHGEELSFRVMGHQYDAQGQYDAGIVWKEPLRRGQWMEFLLRVKFSSDSNVGFVELWKDGEVVVPQMFHQTLYPGGSVYLKQGLYRDRSINWAQSVYHDGLTVYSERPEHLLQGPGADPGVTDPEAPPAEETIAAPSIPTEWDPEQAGCGQATVAGVLFPLAGLSLLPLIARLRRRR